MKELEKLNNDYNEIYKKNCSIIICECNKKINDVTQLIKLYKEEMEFSFQPIFAYKIYKELLVYIKKLRDITLHNDFPWNGNIDDVPWPNIKL